MKNEPCHTIRPSLVDHSDGTLPPDESEKIAAHLADCPACRKELRLLEHSLVLLREVWNEAATNEPLAVSQPATQPLAVSRKPRSRTLVWLGSVAAACAVVAAILLSRPAKPKEEIDVLEYIAREERSARLAASVQILAERPELAQYKEDTERYLKQNYAGTTAVRMLENAEPHPTN